MTKHIPWDVIPDSVGGSVLPTGLYKFEIEEMSEVQSSNGKYMIKAMYRVLEPTEQAGMVLFENYCIGSESDPNGDDPKSWEGIAAARFKDVIKKSATQQRPSVEETLASAKGQQFCADVNVTVEKEGQYKGKERNNVRKTYRVGEVQVGSNGVSPSGSNVRPFKPGVPR